jgi:hypothetical protein
VAAMENLLRTLKEMSEAECKHVLLLWVQF